MQAAGTATATGSAEGHFVKWLTIKDLEESVVEDVARIRAHPLVPKTIPIHGYVHNVRSGRLIEVANATEAGRT